MEKLPIAWVKRIFEHLSNIYKERWTEYENRYNRMLLCTIWSSALMGVNSDEIKRAIKMCQNYPYSPIPTPIEFYHFAKGIAYPYNLKKIQITPESKTIATAALFKMKHQLNDKPPIENNIYG